jgi:hypothetical protein
VMDSESTPPTLDTVRGEFYRQAVAAVARRAMRPGRFTFFEAAKEGDVPEPGHKNWWGAAMGIAAHEGIVVPVDACPSLRPRTSRSLVRVWIGVRFAKGGDGS